MSGFHLVPVAGGEPVQLSLGETVLGRGPLLGVTDKRVSRNHGLLENLNGQLRLKPTHVNPCFVQSSRDDAPRPLQQGSWHLLQCGDLFSLLPGHFIFRVEAQGEDVNGDEDGDTTPRNSQMFEEEEPYLRSLPLSPVSASLPVGGDCQQSPPQAEEIVSGVGEVQIVQSPSVSTVAPSTAFPAAPSPALPAPRRKRVLPAWMLAFAADSAPSRPKVPSSLQQSKRAAATNKQTTAKRALSKRKEEEEELVGWAEEKEEKVEMPKKRRKRTQDEEEEEAAWPKRVVSAQLSPSTQLSSESKGFTMEVDEEERKTELRSSPPVTNVATRRREMSRAETTRDKSKSANEAAESCSSTPSSSCAPSKPQSHRMPCPYGKDCYRKNPLHFQECSHPGDTDYEEEEEVPEEEGEESERPECPYGTDCYRKNPLHRKEYKHTKKPAYNTRNLPKTNQGKNQDSDLDSDQSGYDDSFIDDGDSEDQSNDSDYIPLDSDNSDKEDVRRLQKEAKAFLRKGK